MFGLFRALNAACTTYFLGQIGWEVYKKIRKHQKGKIKASDLREAFIMEYTKNTGQEPSEEAVQAALSSYQVVEHPVRQYFQDKLERCSEGLEKCIEGSWLEKMVNPKKGENGDTKND